MRAALLLVLIPLFGCDKKERQALQPKEEPIAGSQVSPTPGAEDAGKPATERPLYYDRPITEVELGGRTLRELSLLRNTIFARAGHQFRKKWLRDYFTAQSWYEPLPALDESRISTVDRQNAKLIAAAEAKVSKPELEAAAARLQAKFDGGDATPEDEIEIRLVSARLGKWVGGDAAAAKGRSPLEDPGMLDQLLTVEQLENLSRRDLRLLRNLVYARRGYEFKSELLTEYFESTDWYEPDPSFSEKRLTAIDKKNIRLVRSVEDSLGGPLSDRTHMEEDGWFSGA
jgi:hypothetical protein